MAISSHDWNCIDVSHEPSVVVQGVRSLAALAMRCWLRVYDRLAIVGRENLPTNRSYILVSNHASHLDTLCLLSALPIRQLHRTFPLAARDYFCVNPLRSLLARVLVNVMPIERHFPCWNSLSVCAELLQIPGTVLIMFPEGTRRACVERGEPGEFKHGVGLLAAGHDVPVVPCHLAGTHDALPRGAWIPRPRPMQLRIGAPRVYSHLPATRESRTRICRELREAVIALSNPEVP